jgi:hypothetical protein
MPFGLCGIVPQEARNVMARLATGCPLWVRLVATTIEQSARPS